MGGGVVATWLLWAAAWWSPKWSSRETRARGLLAILISSISSQYSASRPTPSPPPLIHKDTPHVSTVHPPDSPSKPRLPSIAVCIRSADASFQTPLPLAVFCSYSKLTRLQEVCQHCHIALILQQFSIRPKCTLAYYTDASSMTFQLPCSLLSFLSYLPAKNSVSRKSEYLFFWHSSTSPVLLAQLASEVAR